MNHLDRRAFLASGAAAGLPSLPTSTQPWSLNPEQPGLTKNTAFAINIEMWRFGKRTRAERIREVAKLGFKFVEFWGRPSDQEIQDLRVACDETGVKITQFTGFGGWAWQGAICNPKAEERNHAKFVEEVKTSCAVAKALDIPMMTIICGNEVPDVSLEAMHNSVIKGLKQAAPICEEQGIMMICEPMNTRVDHRGHCFYGSEHPVRICREVNSPMCKLNWDVYHMQIMEGDLCRRLREGWDQVGYVQIADNPGRQEPGTGEIAYWRVYQELKALGYNKPVGVEANPSGPEREAAIRLAESDNWSS